MVQHPEGFFKRRLSAMIRHMDGYFIYLNSSTLKIALYNGTQPTKLVTEGLLPTALSHSRIVDAHEFAKEFSRILGQDLGKTLPRLPMYFLLEPEVTELFLLTTNKNDENSDEQFLHQIKDRLVDKNPDDLYFGYFKIAPFIYQFVGIKKDVLQTFLDASNEIGLEVAGILPFGLILPKTNNDISSMFIFPHNDSTTIIFSELTGTSFAEKLGKKIALNELIELFWKLSVYNNKNSELNIYTFSENEHIFGSHKVSILGNGDLEKGYEEIEMTKKTLEENTMMLDSQTNLLNLLPVPQVVDGKSFPAVAVASIASILLVGGLILQLTVGFNSIFGNVFDNKVPAEIQENQTVLSEQKAAPAEVKPAEKPKEIKRTDLKIKVENGNGIPGSAGKLKTYLERFGYNVLPAGNSDRTDYAKTTVKLPNDLADYKDLLTNDLKTNYSVEIASVDTRPADYDVLIIAGLN